MRLDRLAGLCQNKNGPWATHRKLVKNLTAHTAISTTATAKKFA